MYCPICKSEFREGFDFCSTCQCSLVEELPGEEGKEILKERKVFLTNVRDENEANMIEAVLNTNCIKISKEYREAGSYLSMYMGNSVMGIDIYVLESTYEAAKELLETEQEAWLEEDSNGFVEDQTLFNEEEIIRSRRRRMKAWIILLFFTPGFLGIIVYLIVIINQIFM